MLALVEFAGRPGPANTTTAKCSARRGPAASRSGPGSGCVFLHTRPGVPRCARPATSRRPPTCAGSLAQRLRPVHQRLSHPPCNRRRGVEYASPSWRDAPNLCQKGDHRSTGVVVEYGDWRKLDAPRAHHGRKSRQTHHTQRYHPSARVRLGLPNLKELHTHALLVARDEANGEDDALCHFLPRA